MITIQFQVLKKIHNVSKVYYFLGVRRQMVLTYPQIYPQKKYLKQMMINYSQ